MAAENDEYKVDKAVPADATDIASLMEQVTGKPADSAEVRLQIQIVSTRDDIRMLVCRDGDDIVGFAMGVVSPHVHPDLSPYLQIETVVVDEQYRGRGIARLFMQKLETWATARNCRYITLALKGEGKAAHDLYRELGYDTDVAYEKFLLGHDDKDQTRPAVQ